MNKLTILELKQAVWDSRFRALFESHPEYKEKFKKLMKDPGCGCNLGFLKTLIKKHKDILQQYFPNKSIVVEEEIAPKNTWVVINCTIDQLEERMAKHTKTKRIMASARWKDKVTVVLNDVAASAQIAAPTENKKHWQVINTTKDDLIGELSKITEGRKVLNLTRWRDQVTLIVNDLSVLF